jgi:hypothetical protein
MSRTARSILGMGGCVLLFSAALAWQGAATDDKASARLPVLNAEPRYWKGNLHTHSLWSDGDDFPEMIVDWYHRHGYNFLTLSDHNRLSEGLRWIDLKPAARAAALEKYRQRFGDGWVEQRKLDADGKPAEQVRLKPLSEFRNLFESPGRFLLIQGEEVTHKYAKNPVHINAINIRDVILPIDGTSVRETVAVNLRLIDEQRAKTGNRIIAILNHPNWNWGVTAEDMLADELKFFEVYNGHPGVKNYGDALRPGAERMWDIVLALRLGKHKLPVIYGVATDDSHAYHTWGLGKTNPGRGWVMVRAPHLTPEAITGGMLAGDFYASTGVTLTDVARQGNRLKLSIKTEDGVRYKTQFVATLRDASLDSEPAKDEKGNPLAATRIYSAEVGKIVHESDSTEPAYEMTGKELYVRARVVSTKPHPNPFQKGDVEMAWTQPLVP